MKKQNLNCGLIKVINNMDIEILPHYKHNPHCNIICYYFMEGSKKIQITFYHYLDGSEDGHEVYYYKNEDMNHFYYSRHYGMKLPKNFEKIGKLLREIFQTIDFEEFRKLV